MTINVAINLPITYSGWNSFEFQDPGGGSPAYTWVEMPGMNTKIYALTGMRLVGSVQASTPLGTFISFRFVVGDEPSYETGFFATPGTPGQWSPLAKSQFGYQGAVGYTDFRWEVMWGISGVPDSITTSGSYVNQDSEV